MRIAEDRRLLPFMGLVTELHTSYKICSVAVLTAEMRRQARGCSEIALFSFIFLGCKEDSTKAGRQIMIVLV